MNNAVARIAGLLAVSVLGIAATGGSTHLTERGFHRTMLVVAAFLMAGIGMTRRAERSGRAPRSPSAASTPKRSATAPPTNAPSA